MQAGSNNTKTTYRTATYQEVQDATATAAVYWLEGGEDSPSPSTSTTRVTYTEASGIPDWSDEIVG